MANFGGSHIMTARGKMKYAIIFKIISLITISLSTCLNGLSKVEKLQYYGDFRHWGEIANFGGSHIMTARGKMKYAIIFEIIFLITISLSTCLNALKTLQKPRFYGDFPHWGDIANFGRCHKMTARGKIINVFIYALKFLIHISLGLLSYITTPLHTGQKHGMHRMSPDRDELSTMQHMKWIQKVKGSI